MSTTIDIIILALFVVLLLA